MAKKLLSLCVVLVILGSIGVEGYKKNEIRVGGLFDASTEDQELVFQLAAEVINEEKILLPWHELVADGVVVNDDQFMVYKTVCDFLEKGVVGIFGPMIGKSSSYVNSVCDSMEMPHIEVRRDQLPARDTCMLNLHPYQPTLSKVYADLVTNWKWTSFTIFYDTGEDLARVDELLKFYDPKGYSVFVRRLDVHGGDGNFRPILTEAKNNGEKNFIIECKGSDLLEILTQAQQVGLINNDYNFIITTLDMRTYDLEPFQYGGANITGLSMVDPNDPDLERAVKLWKDFEERRGKILKENLQATTLQLETALVYDAMFIFTEALYNLNLSNSVMARPLDCDSEDNWEHGYSLINFMRMTNYKGLSGVIKFDHEGFRSDFLLHIVELTREGLLDIGTWNSSEGLNITRMQRLSSLTSEKTSWANKTLIVLTALTKPYGMLKDSPTKLTGNEQYEGFGIELIQELSMMLGFNFTFQIMEDYGSKDKITGEWGGMMRELMEGRADLAITDLTITSDRESVVDFTSPFMNLGISILYKKATKMPPELWSFLAPFSKELWMYMGIAYFGVSFLLFIMGRLSPYEWTNPYPCVEEPEVLLNQFSLTNSFWFTIGSLLQQGTEIAPVATSTRMVAGAWWFFTLIMVSSYTANLAACLTVENMQQQFKSAEDLAAQTEIEYGAKKGGSTESFFKESTYPPYRRLGEFMETHPKTNPKDNDIGILRVQNDNYAFFMESTSIEYVTQRQCDLQQVGGLLDDKGYGIAMPKNSSYRDDFSTAVLKLQEAGKLQKMKDKWWKEKRGGGACDGGGAASEAAELGLANVGGVFIVLVTGVLGSTVTALAEMSFGALTRSWKYKIPFKEELKNEFKFLLQCRGLTKPVRTSSQEEHNDDDLDGNSEKLNEMVEEMNERGNDFTNYGRNIGFDYSSPDILAPKNGRNNSIKN